jgi:glycosyltransferase involved in cell wall biosynthesis
MCRFIWIRCVVAAHKRIVFLAGHLLAPTLASGGDILFAEIAARIGKRRPDWELVALAPDFACSELARSFKCTVSLPTRAGEGRQGSPVSVALIWGRRLRAVTRALSDLKPDLVHSTGDFFVDVWPVVAAKRTISCAWSGVVHHVNAPPLRRKNNVAVATASYLLQRASFSALRGAGAISVLNAGVGAELAALGFASERLRIVGAGIDVARFPLVPVVNRRKRAVWLNRLEPTKGLFDLPEIARCLPEGIVIDVIGCGPDAHVDRLRRALEASGVSDRCILHSFLPDGQLREVMARASVFISCSYEEGWGISIAEALAMGLPCVTYDLPSHRAIFGDAIMSVPVGDTSAFAKAVAHVTMTPEFDDDRRRRRKIAEFYSLDACAARQEHSFAALLGERIEDQQAMAISMV